ncbi:MAG TPA: DUF116 domain-containing protein [archaeon]|nr:DUF116 domain-containing protein [archaeon]
MSDGIARKIRASISNIVDSGAHLDISKTAEAIAKKFGLSSRMLNYTHVEIRNMLNEVKYKATPYNERILFLPHCLKNTQKCIATYSDSGLECKECGNCQIAELKKIARGFGYKGVFITPGGSMVQKLIEKHNPAAALGVCCYDEANIAFEKLRGKKIAPQVVLLMRDGCKDTIANIEEVKEKMAMIDKEAVRNGKTGIKQKF